MSDLICKNYISTMRCSHSSIKQPTPIPSITIDLALLVYFERPFPTLGCLKSLEWNRTTHENLPGSHEATRHLPLRLLLPPQ